MLRLSLPGRQLQTPLSAFNKIASTQYRRQSEPFATSSTSTPACASLLKLRDTMAEDGIKRGIEEKAMNA